MADEGVTTAKPQKGKRPKSSKTVTETIPMDTVDAPFKSNGKFNELLQQAVDQTLTEAKAEKKKKKKKGQSDIVLESLRKGEGLQKDLDETVAANTFDPSQSKYEKSNKKKQKLLEDLNRQNELEIVDETKAKTKKKKKPKIEETILDDSQLTPKDNTVKISELEASTQKTAGKKKKKKTEDDAFTPRSEDDLSVVTTPKKKARGKKADHDETEEKVLTPKKKKSELTSAPAPEAQDVTPKKKKKKPQTTEEAMEETPASLTETLVSPKGKKKKKAVVTDDETAVLSPAGDVTSPGRKKKKKKEGDEEAVLSGAESVTSPKDRKKKKKADEEVAGPSQETIESPKPKPRPRKKKKKEGEEGEREEVQSPTEEEVETPKPKERKKKKKKAEEEQTEEETEEPADDETTKKKTKKKKKKKTAEDGEATEEEAEPPSGMDVEDEGRILAVTIHRTDKLKNDFYIMHPMIRVHVLDELTGKYLPKQHKDRAVTAYYETENEKVTHVLPIMTKPFDFKQNKSVLPMWEELLIFNENYNYFIQDRPKVLLIFELLDFVSMGRAAQDRDHEQGWHRIAWAFLKVLGNNRKINAGSKVRLQLFEAPSGTRKKADMAEVFQWWREASRVPYPSTLYVTLKGIRPPSEVEPGERSLFATQQERGRMTYEDLKKSINWSGKLETKQRNMSSWSRLAGQVCRIPNILTLALPTAKKGCYIIRFSRDGRSIACACHGKEGYPILVYEIPSGALKGKFLGHFGVVYDMCWSKMDTHLMSASADGTVRIWNLEEFGEQQQKLLPHPAFVYCAQFHPRVDNIVVTGGFDQVIRIWDVSFEEKHMELRQELEDHVGYVNSICFSEDGQKMYSADSIGVVIIWNSFFTEIPSKRGVARDWTIFQKIEDPEIKGTAINYIQLHPRERRLLVHCRDNIIRMFDLRIQRVVQKYIGALNFREQLRSTITPCGSFVFSGSEDNLAYAWNTDTGDQVIMYSELNYQNPVTDVHYHPRDHMVAFCSLGENHPVLIYSYDVAVAQYDAGLSPRHISPTPRDEEEKLGTVQLEEELATKGVLTKEEFQLHTASRFDKVMKTLNKVTTQMTSTPMLDLPGMAATSPRHAPPTLMTIGTGYDSYRGTPRSLTGSPTMFSPHAQRSMASVMHQQQFSSQNMYIKSSDSWRPTFSEVGRYGTRSTSPVFGRAPQLNLTTSQGKAQFNFQAAPGKAASRHEKAVVMYDYKAQRSDELNLFQGDEVIVLHRDTENWWMGELADGQQGYFPSNYVTLEEPLVDTQRSDFLSPDMSDTEKKTVTAVRTKSGELKFISGEEESEDDLLESNRTRRRKKRNSQDSGGSLSGASHHSNNANSKKPPKKSGQKVRINETQESTA